MAEVTMLEFVVSELKKSSGEWPKISTATGVPYHTITKIAQGRTENPRINTVEALAKYFRKTEEAPTTNEAA